MQQMGSSTRNFRHALSALLMLVLALAPFEARFMMAAHAGSHNGTASASASTHDQHATGHHDQTSHDHGVLAQDDGVQIAVDDGAGTSHEHHDHAGGPDGACCGTFCHSACIAVAVFDIPSLMPSTVFDQRASAPLIAVVQGQLQRPPSRLLSI